MQARKYTNILLLHRRCLRVWSQEPLSVCTCLSSHMWSEFIFCFCHQSVKQSKFCLKAIIRFQCSQKILIQSSLKSKFNRLWLWWHLNQSSKYFTVFTHPESPWILSLTLWKCRPRLMIHLYHGKWQTLFGYYLETHLNDFEWLLSSGTGKVLTLRAATWAPRPLGQLCLDWVYAQSTTESS